MSKIKNVLDNRNIKYGLNSLLLSLAVIIIAVLLNLLVQQNPVKIDLTANKLYSIGDTTKNIIGKLDKNVVIYGLFDDGKIDSDYKGVNDLLSQYQSNSNGYITIKYIDPDKDTKIINQLDPEGTLQLKKNDFVVVSGNKRKKLSYEDLFQIQVNKQSFSQYSTGSLAEQGFTSAINYVSAKITPAVYFVQSEGEDNFEAGYKSFKSNLEDNNYIIKTLDLGAVNEVPKDTGILVFLSPKKDISSNEKDVVQKYLDNGGKAAFIFNFLGSGRNFPEFQKILKEYNISINYDRVKESDDTKHLPGNPYALILDVGSSKIVPLEFSGMLMTDSRSINILKNENSKLLVTPLIKTDDSAYGEQVDKNSGTNNKGPLILAAAVENKVTAKPSQIIVSGSSAVITENSKQENATYFSPGMYFYVSTLNWMQDRSTDVVIGVKAYQNGKISISEFNARVIGVLVILIIPLTIFIRGFSVWQRRRNL